MLLTRSPIGAAARCIRHRSALGVVLIGGGGHAKAIVEAIESADLVIDAYVDPKPCNWLEEVAHYPSDEAGERIEANTFVLGIGGVDPDGLGRRLDVYRRYRARSFTALQVVHPTALVSDAARLGAGCVILTGAIVQPGAVVGDAAIVNSGAIVEHDSDIGVGAHIAPGAVVLGGASVGRCAMIGAGAVVLPGAEVPSGTLVPALERFPK